MARSSLTDFIAKMIGKKPVRKASEALKDYRKAKSA